MNGIWFLKCPLIIFFMGFLVCLAGALWKIRHWPMGDELLTIGSIICGIAVVLAIVKLLLMKKTVE